MSAQPQSERPADPPDEERDADPAIARAEELVDHAGERLGYYVLLAGRSAMKALARAREEAEDIWAEAQHLRRNGRS